MSGVKLAWLSWSESQQIQNRGGLVEFGFGEKKIFFFF